MLDKLPDLTRGLQIAVPHQREAASAVPRRLSDDEVRRRVEQLAARFAVLRTRLECRASEDEGDGDDDE